MVVDPDLAESRNESLFDRVLAPAEGEISGSIWRQEEARAERLANLSPIDMFTTPAISLTYQVYRLAYLLALAILTIILGHNVRRLVALRAREAEHAAAERVHREQVQGLFARYFSSEIASYLSKFPQDLGGRLLPVTVAVIDVRGFTTRSERMGPEASVAFLNSLFELLVAIVFRHRGTLDKFLGDGMLVVFGTPESKSDDADRALLAATEMVLAARQRDVKIGVGLHSGEVLFGNIGSPQRMELTVIGDAVNSASRIEGLNRKLGTELLVSETTWSQLSHPPRAERLASQELRGRAGKLVLYAPELVGPTT